MKELVWSGSGGDNEIILITLGGSSGSDEEISTIARAIASKPDLLGKIFWGSGNPPVRISKREEWRDEIVAQIEEKCKMWKLLDKPPLKIIFVGKSMGGCVLHKASAILTNKQIDVDLFIGVDMSCHIKAGKICHYKKYKEDPAEYSDEAKTFYDNVLELVNFYQLRGGQCGHPARRDGSGIDLDEEKININANMFNYNMTTREREHRDTRKVLRCDFVNIIDFKPILMIDDNQPGIPGPGVPHGIPGPVDSIPPIDTQQTTTYQLKIEYEFTKKLIMKLCDNADHMSIDTCQGLLKVIHWLIYEEIGFEYDNGFPTFNLHVDIERLDGTEPVRHTFNELDVDGTAKRVGIPIDAGTESKQRKVTVTIEPAGYTDYDQEIAEPKVDSEQFDI